MKGDREMYLTIQQVSEKLGFSYVTIYGWVKRGKIPSYNWNGAYRISDKELRAFIKAGKSNNVKVGVK